MASSQRCERHPDRMAVCKMECNGVEHVFCAECLDAAVDFPAVPVRLVEAYGQMDDWQVHPDTKIIAPVGAEVF